MSEAEIDSAFNDELTDQQKDVLNLRNGVGTKHGTFQEVSERLEITRERVRQIENRAMTVLRAFLTAVQAGEKALAESHRWD